MKPKVGEANAALCVACVAFTVFFFMASDSTVNLLVGNSFSVYDGRYWLLVSNVTVHGGGVHLIFNLMWLWYLGNAMEEAMGSVRYMTFVVTSAFVSSGFQLISSVSTGIGISGVVCAMAGFMWATRRDIPIFGFIMPDQRLSRFILILALMIPLDMFIVSLNIAHFAHFGGLAFGLAVGRASSNSHTRPEHLQGIVAVILLVGFVSTSLVWAPWSKSWNSYQTQKQNQRDRQTAIDVFEYLEFERMRREDDVMNSLIQKVNSKDLSSTDRLAAAADLGKLTRQEGVQCLIANLLLGDDGIVDLNDLPMLPIVKGLGRVAVSPVLDALATPFEPRHRAVAVLVLMTIETRSRAEALIKARIAQSEGEERQHLARSLDVLHESEGYD